MTSIVRASVAAVLMALLTTACTSSSDEPAPSASRAAEIPTASPTSATSPSVIASATATERPTAWRELSVDGAPTPREDHTWTASADGSTAYLFGGRDGGKVLDDLWAYDLTTDAWTRLDPVGPRPPARFGHNAVWSEEHGLIVFAGQAGTSFFNDVWAFEPGDVGWRLLAGAGDPPLARYGSCATLDADGNLLVSHGFTSDGTRFADTRRYDFSAQAWTDVTPSGTLPVNRCLHACWLATDGTLVLYAGQTTGVTALGDLWRLAPAGQWARADGDLPAPRNLPATARWRDATVAYGGQAEDGTYLADVWLLPDQGAAVAISVTGPSGRAGAELVADPARGRLLLFGGKDAAGARADLWELQLP